MNFKIKYNFSGDVEFHTCYVTYEQYQNFKNLPSIDTCTILKESKKDFEDYVKAMQRAIDLAVKNDTSHILKLSECV